MNSAQVVQVILAILVFAGGGGIQWLISRRKSSGSSRFTDSEVLWQQSSEFRQALADEVTALRGERDKLWKALSDAKAQVEAMSRTLLDSDRRISDYEREIRRLTARLPDEQRAHAEAVAASKAEQAAARAERKARR